MPDSRIIWHDGHELSWQRVSIKRYPHFVHITAEQLIDGEVLGDTTILPVRALPALIEALSCEVGDGFASVLAGVEGTVDKDIDLGF